MKKLIFKTIDLRRNISIVLILTMLITSIFVYQPTIQAKSKNNKPKVVKELTDERTVNSNTYLMSDGTKKKDIFLENIRYKEDEKLVDYDSSLGELDKKDKKILNEKTDKKSADYLLCNEKGDKKHFFPTELNEQTGVILTNKNYSLSMAPIIEDEVFEINSKDNKIEYITPQKDLKYEYISLNNGVKENIILNKKPEKNEFSYKIDTENIYLKQKKNDKGIFIVDRKKGKGVGYINPPNIIDGKGNADYKNVEYQLTEDNDSAVLNIVVNKGYFDNENLKYPVTIDPFACWMDDSMSTVGVWSVNYMANSRSTGNPLVVSNKLMNTYPYNTEQRIYLNTKNLLNGGDFFGDCDSLEDMYIETASLRFVESAQPSYYPDGGNVEIKRVEDSWNESTITWNNQPSISNDVLDSVECSGEQDNDHDIDITDWVQDISNGKVVDNGLVFVCPDEGSAASIYGPPINYVIQNDHTYFSRHMFITVYYYDVDSYDTTVFMDCGFEDLYNRFEVSIEDKNELGDGVTRTGFKIYARKDNSDKFEAISKGDDISQGAKFTLDGIDEKIDFRTCILYSDGTVIPSNIVTLIKQDKEEETTVEETEETSEEVSTQEETEEETEEEESEEETEEETEIEETTYNLSYTFVPTIKDTDGDGLEDGYEIWDFKTYWNTKEQNSNDYIIDTDGDELPDGYEVNVQGSNPNDDSVNYRTTDSDNDGLTDYYEYVRGTDPHLSDSDFDYDNDNNEQYPRKTGQRFNLNSAANTTVYQSDYDKTYTEVEDNCSFTYTVGIYSGLTKRVGMNYNDASLNKEMKYFYDKKGNRTMVIENFDGQYSSNYPKTTCISYTYDSDNNVTYIASQYTRYSMTYDNEGNMTDLQVGGVSIIGNDIDNIIDNQGENGDISNLSIGDVITKDRDTSTYGNNQVIKTDITKYKTNENDLTQTSEMIEVFYGNDTSPTYKTKLNNEGMPLKIYDYSEDENNPVEYTYSYNQNGSTMTRSDSFTKTVTESTDESTGESEKTIEYGYKDVLNNNATNTVSIESHTPSSPQGEEETEPQQDVDMTLYNNNNYHYEVSADGKVITGELEDTNNSYNIFKTTQTELTNTSSSFEMDCHGTTNDRTFNYTYDKAGNIKEIKLGNSTKYEYEYDPHHRLDVEKDYDQEKIVEYDYNISGNITARREYDMDSNGDKITSTLNTISYTYGCEGWGDKLMGYQNDVFTYDNAGNPTSYRDGMEMTWSRGRELARIDFSNNTNVQYKYNKDGLRTYKNSPTEEVTYEWDEDKLIREKVKKKSNNKVYDIWYLYDCNDSPIGYSYSYTTPNNSKTTSYIYYEKNIQGDIIGLILGTGYEIATYKYDAWGNITSTTHSSSFDLAYSMNHLFYRGYYRDSESGFYYLQSRYYDSVTMRFLNVDEAFEVDTQNDYIYKDNLFIYCNANPVNNVDYSGEKSKLNNKQKRAKKVIKSCKTYILRHSVGMGVDSVVVGGVIYAEWMLNINWLDYFDGIAIFGVNTSVGVGQVKIKTAKMLEKKGYVKIKTKKKNHKKYIKNVHIVYAGKSYKDVYFRLLNDEVNIIYVTAYLKYLQDSWKKKYPKIKNDLAILGTLYNKGKGTPKKNPKPNKFGKYVKKSEGIVSNYLGIKTV